MDPFLLDKRFMGSTSIFKELLITSGITNAKTIREQVCLVTREEHEFPLLQKIAMLDLPLKSYYVYAQIQDKLIQVSLQQVVVKSADSTSDPKTITIKSKTIPTKHIYKLMCDSLWNQIQQHSHINKCEKHHLNNAQKEEEKEYSIADRLKFEKIFMQYSKKVCALYI
jgi:hypothetical protein